MKVPGFDLIKQLGEGGNGWVWRASRDDPELALKVLKKTESKSESYLRFRHEIEVLRKLASVPGVLPILDAHLPDEPSDDDRAWLAMPLAKPIREHLGERPKLPIVVEGCAAIASTLANLAESGISHRDVKPENLYVYNGQWVIGDFGLAKFPGKDAITENERALGPRFYIADEMVRDPAGADGTLADVYSFAKTLWVLAAAQNYPPQGHQLASIAQISLLQLVAHHSAGVLDQLIERCTRYEPSQRPKMKMVFEELREWGRQPEDLGVAVPTPSFFPSLRSMLTTEEARLKSVTIKVESIGTDLIIPYLEKLKEYFAETGLSLGHLSLNDGVQKGEFRAKSGLFVMETTGKLMLRICVRLSCAASTDLSELTLRASVNLSLPQEKGRMLRDWAVQETIELESAFVERRFSAIADRAKAESVRAVEVLHNFIKNPF